MKKIGHFDVCKIMAQRNLDIRLSPLNNVRELKKVKAGTNVTIGIHGDVINGIMSGQFIGGFLLCDAVQYQQIVKELEDAALKP